MLLVTAMPVGYKHLFNGSCTGEAMNLTLPSVNTYVPIAAPDEADAAQALFRLSGGMPPTSVTLEEALSLLGNWGPICQEKMHHWAVIRGVYPEGDFATGSHDSCPLGQEGGICSLSAGERCHRISFRSEQDY